MKTTYVGIDPGPLSGAFCVRNNAGWRFHKMPNKLSGIVTLITQIYIGTVVRKEDVVFILELPHSYHRGGFGSTYNNSAKSSVNFALHCGRLEGIIRCLMQMEPGISLVIADPLKWIRSVFPQLEGKPEKPKKPRKPRELYGVKGKEYNEKLRAGDEVVKQFHQDLRDWHRKVEEFTPILRDWQKRDKQYRRDLVVQWIGPEIEESGCWYRGHMVAKYGYEDAYGLVRWYLNKLENKGE